MYQYLPGGSWRNNLYFSILYLLARRQILGLLTVGEFLKKHCAKRHSLTWGWPEGSVHGSYCSNIEQAWPELLSLSLLRASLVITNECKLPSDQWQSGICVAMRLNRWRQPEHRGGIFSPFYAAVFIPRSFDLSTDLNEVKWTVINLFFFNYLLVLRTILLLSLKGQCQEIFCFWFFHESVSPKPLIISLGPFRIFSKIRWDIRSSRFATGVVETGGKWKKSSIKKIFDFFWTPLGCRVSI